MTTLPSGTVTFLFTDIEGSTQQAQTHPAAWPDALSRHLALVDTAISAHHGHCYKSTGDGLCAAFAHAPEAVRAASDAQQGLHAEAWGETGPIGARLGIHSGEAEPRDGEYEGYTTLSRTQRLMSAGHGGQVLLSQAACALTAERLPSGISLRDLGERRLKDFSRPEHIFQLDVPGFPTDFPALKTLDAVRNNLPLQATSFIGREREVAELKTMLAQTRLLTLTGVGGTGKTRLSLQVAADVLEGYSHGAWFVELAPLSDGAQVSQAVANALGVELPGARPVIDSLLEYLHDRTLLLILDNCEHLIEACARFATAVLRACPNARIIATSREALGVSGEASYRVPSLDAPDPRQLPPLDSLLRYDAVRLFVERATAAHSAFRLDAQNAPAVAQVCRRLDGIPLALELAAARVKMFKMDQLAARLDDRFRLLTGGSRTALPRQQTLRALVDWSYDLLPDAEKALLRRLSVFVGGWTLEAAEVVCSDEALPAADILDRLTHLVDKSLVSLDEKAEETRYVMLETIRQYGHDRLLDAREAETLRERHLRWAVQFTQGSYERMNGPDLAEWMVRYWADYDNFRAALDWAIEGDHAMEAVLLLAELGEYWLTSGTTGLREQIDRVFNLPEVDDQEPLVLARAYHTYAYLLRRLGSQQAGITHYEHAIALARSQGAAGRTVLARILMDYGPALAYANVPEKARASSQEALEIADELEDQSLQGMARVQFGFLEQMTGNPTASLRLNREARVLLEEVGNVYGIAISTQNILIDLGMIGDHSQALTLLPEQIAICRKLHFRHWLAIALGISGRYERIEKHYAVARQFLEEAIQVIDEVGVVTLRAWYRHHLGRLELEQGRCSTALPQFRNALDIMRPENLAHFDYMWLVSFAMLAQVLYQPEVAARLLGAANMSEKMVYFWQAQQNDTTAVTAAARAALGEEAFDREFAAGQALSRDEAMQLALSLKCA